MIKACKKELTKTESSGARGGGQAQDVRASETRSCEIPRDHGRPMTLLQKIALVLAVVSGHERLGLDSGRIP